MLRSCNRHSRAEKIKHHAGDRGDRMFVLHVGVRVPEQIAPCGPSRRILVPASLREVKGHRYLVDAVAILRDRGVSIHVDIVGDGPTYAGVSTQVAALGLSERVTLRGGMPHSELLERLDRGSWSIVVLPSVVTESGEQEGIPVSLMEAMSRGIPVIATSTGSIPCLLQDGAGLLVPPADPQALADAIDTVQSDPHLAARLAATGRRRIEESFEIDHIAAELDRHFNDCPSAS